MVDYLKSFDYYRMIRSRETPSITTKKDYIYEEGEYEEFVKKMTEELDRSTSS